MAEPASLRDRLRRVPSVAASFPYFDTDAAPAEPMPLFHEWLDAAIDGAVSQPLAMSIATTTPDGHPSNRTLLLKDADATSLWFSSLASSAKGRELADNPEAALVLYWREQGRQLRFVGTVEQGPREVSERDFLQRSPNARARAIASVQGEPIRDLEARLADAQETIENDPGFVPADWTAYRLTPHTVEFWQAERERDQVRLRYLRDGDNWVKDLIWP